MQTSVLFVDDDTPQSSKIHQIVRTQRPDWQVHVQPPGVAPARFMAEHPVDVIVDGQDDSQTFPWPAQLESLYPNCVRLSIDQNAAEPETLVDQIERVCGVHSRLHDPELQSIVSGILDPTSLTSAASEYVRKTPIPGFTLDDYFKHARNVGRLAEAIASVMIDLDHRNLDSDGAIALTKYALVAGTLHDIGKLVLAIHKTDDFREALSLAEATGRPLWQAEMAVYGTTHAAIGAHLLCSWGYPRSMVDALALHHQPSLHSSGDHMVLMAVHVANAIERPAKDLATSLELPRKPSWDEDFLDELGLLDRVRRWELRHRHSR